MDGTGLAMHKAGCPINLTPEGCRNALVPKAYAENGRRRVELADEVEGNTAVIRGTRPW